MKKTLPISMVPDGWVPGWSWLEYKGIWWMVFIANKHAQHAHLHGPFAKAVEGAGELTFEVTP